MRNWIDTLLRVLLRFYISFSLFSKMALILTELLSEKFTINFFGLYRLCKQKKLEFFSIMHFAFGMTSLFAVLRLHFVLVSLTAARQRMFFCGNLSHNCKDWELG